MAASRGKKRGGKRGNKHEGKTDGRIGRLDESTIGYYRRVSDKLREGFEEDEGKHVFLRNVFNELKDHELEIARNQTASHILEDLLQHADAGQLEEFIKGITKDLETAVHDRFACHVVQAALSKAGDFIQSGENCSPLSNLIVQISKTFVQFVEGVVVDTYASHVLKTIFEVLSGVKILEEVSRSRLSRSQRKEKIAEIGDKQDVPEEFKEILNEFISKIKELHNLSELILHPIASTILEALLLVLQTTNEGKCQKLSKVILKKCSAALQKNPTEDGKPPLLMVDTIGSHLFEVLIKVSTDKSFKKVYTEHFSGCLVPIMLHPIANHIVQTILQKVNTEEQLQSIFDEMSNHFEDLLAVNHIQVLQRLASACCRVGIRQKQFIDALLTAFHCLDPEYKRTSCVPLLCSLKTYEVYYGTDEHGSTKTASISFSIQGSLLIQEMLKFKHCKIIITSLLAMSPDDLVTMACDSCGSHIVDVFLQCPSVGEKKMEQLVNKLKGYFMKICCDKNGSRSIDTLWKLANLKIKFAIIEEVAPQDRLLQSDRFGRFIYRNLAVDLFKKKKNEWKELQNREIRKQRMLKELVSDNDQVNAKEKETKSEENPDLLGESMEATTASGDQIGDIFVNISKKKKSKSKINDMDEMTVPKKKKRVKNN